MRKAEEYNKGHIPGAVSLPVNKTFRQTGNTDRIGGPAYIQQLLGNAGVDRKKHVVVYDDGKFADARRMFWLQLPLADVNTAPSLVKDTG